jgi:tellurite resistance-related uncharacterized protein
MSRPNSALFPSAILSRHSNELGTYGELDAISNAIDYAKFRSHSHDAVIRVYDDAGNVIETHEHAGEFREP